MNRFRFAPRLICLAVAGAFPAAAAADEAVEALIRPASSVTLGIGSVDTDNQRFGAYNGLAEEGEHLIGEAALVRRDDASATWYRLNARDLGLPTRELRVDHERQGQWGYYLEYSQTPKYTPYDVHTALGGIGSANQSHVVNTGNAQAAPSPVPETLLKTDRYKTTLGFYRAIGPALEFSLKFQNEEKEGSRPFGRGTFSVQEFLAEPIDSTTRQLDLVLSYTGEQLQLSGGYYGSFYDNHHRALLVSGGAAGLTAAPALSPIALPPDNLAHQFHLAGSYQFTRTTRGSFKASYARNTQTDAFILPVANARPLAANTGTNDSGRSDLGGRLDTTLLQLGLTSRPTAKLSLLANLRYEDRDDKTAVAQYIFPGNPATATTDGYNEPRSLTTTSGKAEASYQLPGGYRVTGGVDYEKKDRTMQGVRVVGYREQTEELSYRAELKRSLADSVMGTLSLVAASRDGSAYRNLLRLDGTTLYPAGTAGGLVAPIYIADRDRNKVKALVDWLPVDALSLQFTVEDARDSYGRRNRAPDVGVRSGDARLYGIDATYSLNDRWQLTGFASAFDTRVDQAAGRTDATYWTAALKNVATTIGVGIRGKLGDKFDLGADLTRAEDTTEYRFGGAATASLPDIESRQTTVRLFGRYRHDKSTAVRFDYVYDRRSTNDWTWNGTTAPSVYTDGTRLYQNPNEKVHFVGISLQYSFR